MKLFGREIEGSAKMQVILVAVLLVSAGMCGLQLTMANNIYNSSGAFGPIMILLGILELIAMFVSLIGIAIVLVHWLARKLLTRDLDSSRGGTVGVFHITSQIDEPDGPSPVESHDTDEDSTR
jgi:hypothetical protein